MQRPARLAIRWPGDAEMRGIRPLPSCSVRHEAVPVQRNWAPSSVLQVKNLPPLARATLLLRGHVRQRLPRTALRIRLELEPALPRSAASRTYRVRLFEVARPPRLSTGAACVVHNPPLRVYPSPHRTSAPSSASSARFYRQLASESVAFPVAGLCCLLLRRHHRPRRVPRNPHPHLLPSAFRCSSMRSPAPAQRLLTTHRLRPSSVARRPASSGLLDLTRFLKSLQAASGGIGGISARWQRLLARRRSAWRAPLRIHSILSLPVPAGSQFLSGPKHNSLSHQLFLRRCSLFASCRLFSLNLIFPFSSSLLRFRTDTAAAPPPPHSPPTPTTSPSWTAKGASWRASPRAPRPSPRWRTPFVPRWWRRRTGGSSGTGGWTQWGWRGRC